MRASIELAVSGSTIQEIENAALQQWREFICDPSAEIPDGSEIVIEPGENSGFRARVLVRTKR